MTTKDIVKDFIEGTGAWHKAFKEGYDTSKPCPLCGIVPDNMLELVEAIKELKEKAWMYDGLNK